MTDRSRDTSEALTEVRTVLSRAETATVNLLWGSYRGNIKQPNYVATRHETQPYIRWHQDGDREATGETYDLGDPDDIEAMYEALQEVRRLLERWRRTGKKRR